MGFGEDEFDAFTDDLDEKESLLVLGGVGGMKLGGGAAVRFDTKGSGGQLILPGHQAADFSLSQAIAPLPTILKEIGHRVDVLRPVGTVITVDSYRKETVSYAKSTFKIHDKETESSPANLMATSCMPAGWSGWHTLTILL